MRIWINAFIPGVVEGYTVELPPGGGGLTAVPLPAIARLNPLNFGKPLDAGYLTDQRSFDSDLSASCRMQSIAELSPSLVGWQLDNGFVGEHRTSGTTEVRMETGEHLDFAWADMSRCAFSGGAIPAPGAGVPFTQIFYLKGAAYDPLVSASADIDYDATFVITTTPGIEGDVVQIDWQATIDDFPAFEGYAERNGDVLVLFTEMPPSGHTVENLLGGATTSIAGSVTFYPTIVIEPS